MSKKEKNATPAQVAQRMTEAAKEFETSRIELIKRNNKLAWKITGVSVVAALAAIGSVAVLTPLKTVEPYVVRVDNNTGQTDIVYALKDEKLTHNEALDRFWLQNYVTFRESYDWYTVQSNYDTTMMFSDQAEQTQLASFFASAAAPYKMFKNNYRVEIRIISISYVGELAQVRFERRLRDLNDPRKQPVTKNLIATIAYEYRNENVSAEERLANPLGFKVTSYKTDVEN